MTEREYPVKTPTTQECLDFELRRLEQYEAWVVNAVRSLEQARKIVAHSKACVARLRAELAR